MARKNNSYLQQKHSRRIVYSCVVVVEYSRPFCSRVCDDQPQRKRSVTRGRIAE